LYRYIVLHTGVAYKYTKLAARLIHFLPSSSCEENNKYKSRY
jgi:hypothetical protein